MSIIEKVPDVTFKTRVRDESVGGSNPFRWQDQTTDDIFGGSQSWYDLAIGVSDTDENTLFVGVLNVWKSTNGGDNFTAINSWSAPTSPSYTHADIHFLDYIDGKFFAGTDGGVYVSTNNGTLRGYFKFDPRILLSCSSYKIGDF